MADQLIPLDNSPNQVFQVPLNLDGKVKVLVLILRYNEIAQYWVATIKDNHGLLIVDSIPLITGVFPSANILSQFAYLSIGSMYLVNASNVGSPDYPNNSDLGTDYVLVWSDTPQ